MKKLLILSLFLTVIFTSVKSQTNPLEVNRNFEGAKANLKQYHAIYQLDSNNPQIIEKALRNINNAMQDPRLQGKRQQKSYLLLSRL